MAVVEFQNKTRFSYNVNKTQKNRGVYFNIYGDDGIISGQCLAESGDSLKWTHSNKTIDFQLTGQWFNDGFIGTMADLMIAIEQDRETSLSGKNNIPTMNLIREILKKTNVGS